MGEGDRDVGETECEGVCACVCLCVSRGTIREIEGDFTPRLPRSSPSLSLSYVSLSRPTCASVCLSEWRAVLLVCFREAAAGCT
mmetsp:Transcript_15398/g.22550  ORF Transcript_15398/g.22550 Transcript_15398/m.22550 type:complete len:84 (-) Transcript_15398:76-327(-)